MRLFFLIVLIFNLGNSSNQFLILRATALGYSDAMASLLYLVYNVIYAFGSYPARRLSDRIGRKTLLVLGYGTYGILYFAFAFTTANGLFVLFGLYGIYSAITDGVEKVVVSDLAPAPQRAPLIGLHAAFTGIGLLPASVLAGCLWDTFGAPVSTKRSGGGSCLFPKIVDSVSSEERFLRCAVRWIRLYSSRHCLHCQNLQRMSSN